jgi:hypothetical protein
MFNRRNLRRLKANAQMVGVTEQHLASTPPSANSVKIAKIKPEVKEATKSASIDGNLHRADLTPDERDEHIQEWHRLTEQGVK